jgi:hypothetical protein
MSMTSATLENAFFAYGDLDTEIAKKLDSMTWEHTEAANYFGEFVALTEFDAATQATCLEMFEGISNAYISLNNSIVHPLRVMVSYILAGAELTFDNVALGLCHNIREVGKGDFDWFEQKFLSPAVRTQIEILSIDRSRERDNTYMEGYYQGIEAQGLMPFKGFDKLDNFLCFVSRDVQPFYYGVVERHVCPPLKTSDPRLSDYLNEVSQYARIPKVRQHYAGQ